MMRTILKTLAGGLLLILANSAMAEDRPNAEWWSVQLAGETFRVERVADPDSRRQGLMGRELAPDEGMLFDFPAGTQPAIWMRNMRISLDLVYIDDLGQVTHIFAEVPPCPSMPCDIYRADQALRFVLELPQGSASRLGLAVGQRLPMDKLRALPVPDA
ncbi:MAG: DUF192 domain-containing protein [Halopseudomonas sp.]